MNFRNVKVCWHYALLQKSSSCGPSNLLYWLMREESKMGFPITKTKNWSNFNWNQNSEATRGL